MKFNELDDHQRLHLSESDQLYRAWNDARQSSEQYRYGMRWIVRNNKRYLIRLRDAKGNGRSLGAESEKTREIFAAFEAGKIRARERYAGLSERLQVQSRLNRALRLGRLPTPAAEIVGAMNKSGLEREFLVVGTHALFAYEMMAGVQISADMLSTGDLDICFDARRPLKLVTDKFHRSEVNGLLGFLQKIDKTYEPVRSQRIFRAVNAKGFMVDIITSQRSMRNVQLVTFGENDLVAAEVPNLHWLINAPKCPTVTIAVNGRPVMMQVPDPRAFALHKAWLSQEPDRNPVKRQRDAGQAKIVFDMIGEYLPNFQFSQRDLRYLSADMIHLALDIIMPDRETRANDLSFENEKQMLPHLSRITQR